MCRLVEAFCLVDEDAHGGDAFVGVGDGLFELRKLGVDLGVDVPGELVEFDERVRKGLEVEGPVEYMAEPKLDGVARL